MVLTIGTKLGSYKIMSMLGKGGKGEVYRARDSKLKRHVAIKILPDEFSRNAERLSRFQREAGVLARISHRLLTQSTEVQVKSVVAGFSPRSAFKHCVRPPHGNAG